MLTPNFVESIIKGELNPRIKSARDMSDKLRLHVDGIGVQRFLEKINNYENKEQFEAREKHAISNKFISEELLRPVDNVFNANGGSKNYEFKGVDTGEKFIEKLVNVRDHSSMSDYIENVWFNKHITDPNGLIFMEITNEDSEGNELDDDDKKIEPCYKSIHSIRDYEQNGLFINWVIFEPHEIILDNDKPDDKEKQKEIFWAVDKKFYYKFIKDKEGVRLFEVPIENSFEKVPAILCSNIIDNVTGWKKSPIDSQIGLLDKYLVDNSVLNITQFFHNYPIPWEYVDHCNKCNGNGNIGGESDSQCDSCGGSGKAERKDPTDTRQLKVPEDRDAPRIDPPAGYTTIPIDAMNQQVVLIDRLYNIIFYSQWGTTQEKGKGETATGRYIDTQPVHNRLDKYSKSAEMSHTALVTFIAEFHFPETFERAIIQYGRRYLIETPDQIWDKYLKAKKDNAPVSTLDLLLSQFLESEFRENKTMFIVEQKKSKLEPFVHWDVVTVQQLNVSEGDYKKKLYFSDWIQTKTSKEIFDTSIEDLDKDFETFIKDKVININQNSNDGNK
jgi:hypothetical protein